MPGDPANNNDDELVNQIDELKARMDRLMKGGTSTSNSALLTDAPRPTAVQESEPVAAPPPPPRSRVRDLIGPGDPEPAGEEAPAPDVVAFPEEKAADVPRPAPERRSEDRPVSPPPPPRPKPSSGASGGSIISVDEGSGGSRPKVESFDELGSAIEQELARDSSVPPPSSRRGPDLASRFGSADEPVVSDRPETVIDEEPVDQIDVEEIVEEIEDLPVEEKERSHAGAIVAIWVFTAITSGTIATLHFTGII